MICFFFFSQQVTTRRETAPFRHPSTAPRRSPEALRGFPRLLRLRRPASRNVNRKGIVPRAGSWGDWRKRCSVVWKGDVARRRCQGVGSDRPGWFWGGWVLSQPYLLFVFLDGVLEESFFLSLSFLKYYFSLSFDFCLRIITLVRLNCVAITRLFRRKNECYLCIIVFFSSVLFLIALISFYGLVWMGYVSLQNAQCLIMPRWCYTCSCTLDVLAILSIFLQGTFNHARLHIGWFLLSKWLHTFVKNNWVHRLQFLGLCSPDSAAQARRCLSFLSSRGGRRGRGLWERQQRRSGSWGRCCHGSHEYWESASRGVGVPGI